MNRWEDVEEQMLFGMPVKMYRDPFEAVSAITSSFSGLELDHYAYKYFQNSLYMYRIMDTNWEQYMEERGDIDELKDIQIPTKKDEGETIL